MSNYYPFAPQEQERELYRSEARRCFSRVGWACCAMMLAAQLCGAADVWLPAAGHAG